MVTRLAAGLLGLVWFCGCGLFDPLGNTTRLMVVVDPGDTGAEQIQVRVLGDGGLLDESARVPEQPAGALAPETSYTLAMPDDWADLELTFAVDGWRGDDIVATARRDDITLSAGRLVREAFALGAPCGDGQLTGDEACDDGNTDAGDGCDAGCAIEEGAVCTTPGTPCTFSCGDGSLQAGEGCDDGNGVDADGCTGCVLDEGYVCPVPGAACEIACGNGAVDGDEACDDGNGVDADGCTGCVLDEGYVCPVPGAACEIACGNGAVDGDEACDDGNGVDADGCTGCVLDEGYVCPVPGAACEVACGNGAVDADEECDDGNIADADGCSGACAIEPGFTCINVPAPSTCFRCGDGLLAAGHEACDDGNLDNDDGCSAACEIEDRGVCREDTEPSVCGRCGNGVIEDAVDEECDDIADTGDCAMCRLAVCGDGYVNAFGNNGGARETCDDGPDNAYLATCSDTCVAATCGDGLVQAGEVCDSAGAEGCGTGCLAVSPEYRCAGMPSICRSSAQSVDGSACAGVPADVGGVNTCLNDVIANAPSGFFLTAVWLGPGVYHGDVDVDRGALQLVGEVDVDGTPLATLEGAVGNGTPTLRLSPKVLAPVGLYHVKVTGAGPGEALVHIESNVSTGYISPADIGPSDGVGVRVTGGVQAVIQRSTIHDNAEGGVEILSDNGSQHQVFVNVIRGNGSPTSAVGGVVIDGGANVNYNSIFDNQSAATRTLNAATVDLGSGVYCGAGTNLVGNIVWDNTGATAVEVDCPNIAFSVVEGYGDLVVARGSEYGEANVDVDPLIDADGRPGPGSICLDYVNGFATAFHNPKFSVRNLPKPHLGSGQNDCGAYESGFYTPAP